MSDRSVLVRLLANVQDFKSQMDSASRSVKGVGDQSEKTSQQATTSLGQLAQSAQKHRQAWDDAGRGMLAFGAVATVAIAGSVKAAIDWESAWAGVTKTVSGTPEQLGKVEDGLRGLARTLPSTHDEIAAVAEAAGQLGVKTDSIVDFTRTMIDLGQTTNLSADEAATSLAQLMNVMQTAPKDVGRLGAALVALGNDGASTEADIVRMASYITGSAKLIGASESDVLALANAMTSMGINAERGGGVMTRVMQDVYAAVQSGGAQLDGFAKVAGMSSKQFAEAFESDPVRAIDSFIRGLNDVEASGGNVVDTLGNLGYIGTQDTAVLLQMKGAGDLLTRSLDLGNKAWDENRALVEEAAKRYDTTASKLAIARNNIHDAAIEVGEVFLPALADLAGGLADVAGWFADLPDPMQAAIGGLTGVAGVTALAGGGFLLLFPRVIETYKAFKLLNTTMPRVAAGMGKMGKAAIVAAGLAILGTAVRSLDEALGPAPGTMEQYTAALLDMDGSVESLNKRFSGLDKGLTVDIDGYADAIKRLTDPSSVERLNDFGGALFNAVTFGAAGTGEGTASRRRILKEIEGLDQALALMVENGNADMAAEQFKLMTDEAKANGVSVKELKELFPGYEDALTGIANKQTEAAQSAQTQAEKAALLAENLDATYSSLEGYAAALGMDEEATKALIEKSNELGQSLADFIDPLGTYTTLLDEKKAAEEEAARKAAEAAGAGADAWEDFVTDTGFSFDEYMQRLRDQVTAQDDWQLNMLRLAGRVSQGTLEELARMGPEGAPLVAELVTKSDAVLDEFDDITARRAKEATDAWGATMTMAAPVLAEIARKGGQGAADAAATALASGTATLAKIASDWGVSIAGGVNPILQSLGKPLAGPTNYRKGSPTFMGPVKNADGNVYEDHSAQIAPGGAWRIWAEPETGGEAYIPLAASKRRRSLDIWRETGRRLDAPEAQYFAAGGFASAADVPRPPSTAPFQHPLSTVADGVMQKAFDEVRAWLTANVGVAGSGSIGGEWQSIYNWVKARVPQARVNSAFRPGDPGYHGRRKAVDFGFGSGPGGAGSAGLALINRTLHDGIGANLAELIYDGLGDDRPDLKNGHPLTYSAATRAEHRNHVHAAVYAQGAVVDFLTKKGGLLNPHIRDSGGPLLPGYTFNGTGAAETVMPNHRFLDAAAMTPMQRVEHTDARSYPLTVTAGPTADQIVRAIRDHQQDMEFLHG